MSPDSVRVIRDADTEIVAGERMAIIVWRYRHEGTDVVELDTAERTLEPCIRAQMDDAGRNFTFLPAEDFRKVVPNTILSSAGSKTADSVARDLAAAPLAMPLADARLRYVVLLDGSYSTSPSRWTVTPGEVGVAVAKEWTQESIIQATIVDLKHVRVSGSVRTRATGSEAAGMMVVFIFPLPVYVNTRAKAGNCSAIGKELADFFAPET